MEIKFKLKDASGAVILEQGSLIEIEGFFSQAAVGLMFVARLESDIEFMEVHEIPEEYSKLFAWMGQERTDVHLAGHWNPPVFQVEHMDFDDGQTNTMIQILLKKMGFVSEETVIPGENSFSFDDRDKVKAFLLLAGETLPEGLREWVQQMLWSRTASATEQGHIQSDVHKLRMRQFRRDGVEQAGVHVVRQDQANEQS